MTSDAGSDAQKKAEAFRDEVLSKIKRTVQEFSEGKLSREQFQSIYERYTEQLTMAKMAVLSGQEDAIDSVRSDNNTTIAMRQALQGKAVGLMIYHNKSGTILETLGKPDIEVDTIGPLLNDVSGKMEANQRVEPITRHVGEKQWLVVTAGSYTTVAMQFRNEPAPVQVREIERLLGDFEQANKQTLRQTTPRADKLAHPFMVFIEKRLR